MARDRRASGSCSAARRWRPRSRAPACYAAALAAYLALRVSAVGGTRHDVPFVDNPLAGVDAATRASNAVLLFARYVSKMLWPQTLSIEYGFDQIPVVPALPWGAIAAVAVAAVVVAAIVVLHRRGQAPPRSSAAFVPAAFAVTGNLAFPIGTIFAERLAYLPLAGFCGLLGLAARRGSEGRRGGGRRRRRPPRRSRRPDDGEGGDYKDVATLSEATAAASPRSVKALFNAGRVRLRQRDAAGAVPLLERAVAIWPDYARAWEMLAEAYAATGDSRPRAEDARGRAGAPGAEPL